MTRQEKKAYLNELATIAAQLEADWNKELQNMVVRFKQEQGLFHELADTIRKTEGQDRINHICRMMKKSQQARYDKAVNDFLTAYNSLVLEYKRGAAELNDPLTINLHTHGVC